MKFFLLLALSTAVLATLAQDTGSVVVLWRGFEARTNIIAAALIFWAAVEILALSLKLGRKVAKRRRKSRGETAEDA
jgi:uncharacterized membrane-anchored protein